MAQAQGQLAAAELKLAQVELRAKLQERDWQALKDMVEVYTQSADVEGAADK